LRAITAYRPRASIASVVRERLFESGIADAIREYRALKQTRHNDFVFDERELEALGRELIDKGQLEGAIAVLELNRGEFPWSPQARFVLGDALANARRCGEARKEYQAASEADRSYPLPQDRFARLKLCGTGGS
jgi:predicted negative regulator of RcsB-dependent stress response